MTEFTVGQEIICVARGDWHAIKETGYCVPVRYQTYTVREVYLDDLSQRVGIRLNEVRNPPEYFGQPGEVGWLPEEFRPVVRNKASLDIFRKALIPNRELVK